MAEGYAPTTAGFINDAFLNATAYTGTSTPFVKLHISAPGSAGTGGPPASLTTRQSLSVGASASVGGVHTLTNDAALTWTSLPTTETFTHFSIWTASSGGTFLASGAITNGSVSAGNTFTIPIGNFTWSVNTAS